MNRRIVFIAILLVAVLVISSGLIAYNQRQVSSNKNIKHPGMPAQLFNYSISTLYNGVANEGFYSNVTQGTTLHVNITFHSLTYQAIEIPLENLTVNGYSDVINTHVSGSFGNASLIHNNAFTYCFSLNHIVVQPSMSNSTVLTINFANNIPLGQYDFLVRTDRIKLIDSQSQSYFTAVELGVIVLPKQS
jgi:hypothetical protein